MVDEGKPHIEVRLTVSGEQAKKDIKDFINQIQKDAKEEKTEKELTKPKVPKEKKDVKDAIDAVVKDVVDAEEQKQKTADQKIKELRKIKSGLRREVPNEAAIIKNINDQIKEQQREKYKGEIDKIGESIEPEPLKELAKPTGIWDKLKACIMSSYELEKKKSDETAKGTGIQQKMRRAITGVLIDLHLLWIMAQYSSVVSSMFKIVAQSIGYVVDMVMIELLPSVISLAEWFFKLGESYNKLNPAIKTLLSSVIATVALVALFTTILGFVISSIIKLIAVVTWLTAVKWKEVFVTLAVTGSLLLAVGAILALAAAAALAAKYLGGKEAEEREQAPSEGRKKLVDAKATIKAISNVMAMGASPFGIAFGGARIASYIEGGGFGLKKMATGGIVTKPTLALIGESGPEVVTPLNKLMRFAEGGVITPMGALGDAIGGLISGVVDSVENIISLGKDVVTSAITGGGGKGGIGLTQGMPTTNLASIMQKVNATMIKGLGGVMDTVSGGFKVANNLLAIIIAILLGMKPGAGAEPEPEPAPVPEPSWLTSFLTYLQTIFNNLPNILNTAWATFTASLNNSYQYIIGQFTSLLTGFNTQLTAVVSTVQTGITNAFTFGVSLFSTAATKAWGELDAHLDTDIKNWSEMIKIAMGGGEKVYQTNPSETTKKLDVNQQQVTADLYGTGAVTFANQRAFEEEKKKADKYWAEHGATSPNTKPSDYGTAYAAGGGNIYGTGAVSKAAEQAAQNLTESLNKVTDNSARTYKEQQEAAMKTSTEASTSVTDVIKTGVEVVASVVSNAIDGAIDTVSNVIDTIVNVEKKAGEIVSNAINEVREGIEGALSDVGGFVSGITGGAVAPPPVPVPPVVGAMLQGGGFIERGGFAYLHRGENVVPAKVSKGIESGTTININNPTFIVKGTNEREQFNEIMRLMQLETRRVRG